MVPLVSTDDSFSKPAEPVFKKLRERFTDHAEYIAFAKPTCMLMHVEPMELRLAAQRQSAEAIKKRLRAVSREAILTGKVPLLLSRQALTPELRTYSEQLGFKTVDRLRTGKSNLAANDYSFPDFLNGLDDSCRKRSSSAAANGILRTVKSANQAQTATVPIKGDIQVFKNTRKAWLKTGEHNSLPLASDRFTAAEATKAAARTNARNGRQRLLSVSKWGRRAGVAGAALTEGLVVGQYLGGYLTERQFLQSQASFGGGLAGAAAGGYLGTKIGFVAGSAVGLLGGPAGVAAGAGAGAKLGAIGGSLAGGFAAAHFAGRGMDSLFQLQDDQQQEEYSLFLLKHYQ